MHFLTSIRFFFSCVSSKSVLIIVSQFELVEGKRGVHIHVFDIQSVMHEYILQTSNETRY